MICHGFKGGIGTASRVVGEADGGWTVGALVQANYGSRALLRVDGVPVGREIGASEVPLPGVPGGEGAGSIIVVLATDAPLLPSQCRRLAQRATIGLARMGGTGGNSSGDIFVAFATGNGGLYQKEEDRAPLAVRMLPSGAMTPLFEAAADATEEAILNALCMATTVTGVNGRVAHAMPLERLSEVLRHYRRLEE
jgi:D-aminopeptidase